MQRTTTAFSPRVASRRVRPRRAHLADGIADHRKHSRVLRHGTPMRSASVAGAAGACSLRRHPAPSSPAAPPLRRGGAPAIRRLLLLLPQFRPYRPGRPIESNTRTPTKRNIVLSSATLPVPGPPGSLYRHQKASKASRSRIMRAAPACARPRCGPEPAIAAALADLEEHAV